jgi:hypothetical protein
MSGLVGVFVVAVVVAVACAEDAAPPAGGAGTVNSRADFKRSLQRDCSKSYTTTCMKLDLVSWVERLSEDDNYQVMPGVSLVREADSARSNTADLVAELARDFPNDAEARLDAFLLKKVTNYLNSHTIRVRLFDDDKNVVSARKKDKGGMGGVMAAMLMMKGTMGALAMGGLAALAGKALMTGLMALMLSAIVGLKSLAGGGHKQTTYEIVSKPVYSHAHTHSASHEEIGHHGGGGGYGGHGGYGRSFEDLPIPLSIQNVSS